MSEVLENTKIYVYLGWMIIIFLTFIMIKIIDKKCKESKATQYNLSRKLKNAEEQYIETTKINENDLTELINIIKRKFYTEDQINNSNVDIEISPYDYRIVGPDFMQWFWKYL